MKTNKFPAKKLAVLAMLSTLAMLVFMVESLLPTMFIPGAKPGLANIFSLVALIMFSPFEAFLVLIVRTVFGAIFAGNMSALLYSLTAGVVSLSLTSVLVYVVMPKVSLLAVSTLSAVVHNIVQNLVFTLLTGTVLTLSFLPYLMLLGVISGAVVGGVTLLVFRGVPSTVFQKFLAEKRT